MVQKGLSGAAKRNISVLIKDKTSIDKNTTNQITHKVGCLKYPELLKLKNRTKCDAFKSKLQEIVHIRTRNKTEKIFTGTKTCLRVDTIFTDMFQTFLSLFF
jgi:hypothetical protein